MTEPFTVGMWVLNKVADKAAYARQASTGERQQFPGWVVVGAFLPATDGQPTCIDYRVRAVPNTHDLDGMQETLDAVAASMTKEVNSLGPPRVTPGGIPRYVFEQASQVQLLKSARATVERSDYYQHELSAEVRSLLASDGRRKPGRPPARGLREKLAILEAVEAANQDGTPLDDVAARFYMSRSSLRDLLSWARHKAPPRLFTDVGRGRRTGELTADARALLREIRGDV